LSGGSKRAKEDILYFFKSPFLNRLIPWLPPEPLWLPSKKMKTTKDIKTSFPKLLANSDGLKDMSTCLVSDSCRSHGRIRDSVSLGESLAVGHHLYESQIYNGLAVSIGQ
jgi:hypothetical protein